MPENENFKYFYIHDSGHFQQFNFGGLYIGVSLKKEVPIENTAGASIFVENSHIY